jgi:ABC-type transport system involved in multi-copper enzyme maturation permease subunit
MAIIPLSAYMAITFSMNTFAVEEKGNLNQLYLSLPVSRKSIVRGRFAFMILLLAVALTCCGAIIMMTARVLVFGAFTFGINPKIVALMCFFGFALGGFTNLTMYPVMFRMGYEKGKVFGFYIPVVFVSMLAGAAVALLNTRMDLFSGWLTYWSENTGTVCAAMFAIGATLFFVSYHLSVYLYDKRDL